jgi:hypothetical protein
MEAFDRTMRFSHERKAALIAFDCDTLRKEDLR